MNLSHPNSIQRLTSFLNHLDDFCPKKLFVTEHNPSNIIRPTITYNPPFPKHQNTATYGTCYTDACLAHTNAISALLNTQIDFKKWSTDEPFWEKNLFRGDTIGAGPCHIRRVYGWSMAIPFLLHWMFVLIAWVKDFRKGETTYFTLPFAILPVLPIYPMYKRVKILLLWRDKQKMEKEKKIFDRDIATLEGFTEAILQVISTF